MWAVFPNILLYLSVFRCSLLTKMHLFQFLKMVVPQVLAGSGEDSKDPFEPASESCVFQRTQASQASVLSLKVTHPSRSLRIWLAEGQSSDKFPHFTEVHEYVPQWLTFCFEVTRLGEKAFRFPFHCCR